MGLKLHAFLTSALDMHQPCYPWEQLLVPIW